MNQPHHDADVLCDLFITMKIEDSLKTNTPPTFLAAMECDNCPAHDEVMYTGCAYLQAIQAQLESYPTTNGEYLEAIFTHREILSAFPPGTRTARTGSTF
ncbi:hypothetical protein CPB85DRAFT_118137 [Mucidula mucida]|nr:hypothetical protein CPB85DRAFT_118137 [Mucidula mucida]